MTEPDSPIPPLETDFYRARSRAIMEELLALLTGKSADLLSYEEVRQKLKVSGGVRRGLQDIPLAAIVGSVGRYADFTRSFLPRRDDDLVRWMQVNGAMNRLGGLPPIEVYQIDQAYFVLDGNHRVSIARQLGATYIEASVIEFSTKVPLSPETRLDDLICKAEYADFLEHTHLDEVQPGADLSVTAPGQYRVLKEQIELQGHFMSQQQGQQVSDQQAVDSWYNQLYLPVIQLIRDWGILQDFPGRTETDLYVWISRHQAELAHMLGWEIRPAVAAADLVTQFSPRPQRLMSRVRERLLDALTPDELEAGPPIGQWRREQLATHQDYHLFTDILVPVNGTATGWLAVEQAAIVARLESGRLHGLHIVASTAQQEGQAARAVQAEFKRRCQAAGVTGELSIEVGGVSRQICEWARWTDLVVLGLAHPPAPQPVARLSSGLGTLLRRCARPVLTVTRPATPFKRALLAYDGSPKAGEALFVATYLARQWSLSLAVLIVLEKRRARPGPPTNLPQYAETLGRARTYLETYGVEATFVKAAGPVAPAILQTAAAYDSDLILMGGYGFRPVLEVVLGSTVDQILRETQQPVLICR